jgi:hypothetical protein
LDLVQLDKALLKNIDEFGAGFIHSTRPISDSHIELIGTYCPSIVPFGPELSRMIAFKIEKTKLASHFDHLKVVPDTDQVEYKA